jgi:hypothetical protein
MEHKKGVKKELEISGKSCKSRGGAAFAWSEKRAHFLKKGKTRKYPSKK